ncbi:MAG: sigma-70 family RNA polymerase sigma factor [Planctomycetota bacterium]
MRSSAAQELLDRSRSGDDRAWSQLLDSCRPWLRVLAVRQVQGGLSQRVDPSDVVQLTCLEAHRDRARFRGDDAREFLGWLRGILRNNVASLVERHVLAQRRSVDQEERAESPDERPRATALPASDITSPSQRAMRGESAVLLAAAILRLPADQGEAVRLRHLEGWNLADMAASLGRSEVAVAGLIKRGLQGLRADLDRSGERDA